MVSPSRRAFLMGRRPPQTAWQAFCSRLAGRVQGVFLGLSDEPGFEQARLVPDSSADVHMALTLSDEYGIAIGLEGVPLAHEAEGPTLWLAPGRQMARCERLEPGSSLWFVQPGCLVGELEAHGFAGMAHLPPDLSVGAWLADRRLHAWPAGHTALSGLRHCSILLADNTQAALGPFGQDNRNPLDSLRLQQLIPALFRLMAGPDAQALLEGEWPGRYRLDALQPQGQEGINLAHLLLGHGGDLAWVEWVVLDQHLQAGTAPDSWTWPGGQKSWQGQELDSQIKALFDPTGRFPHPGQDL